ncbi:hypothetical protein KNO81_39530 [Paraburkholderia sediminicola]|jgi:hypothetical protein|nr:hypothetical protein [Paraburkholderia sediminicola]
MELHINSSIAVGLPDPIGVSLIMMISLAGQEFVPSFLVAPNEFPTWQQTVEFGHEVNAFTTLGEVAKWIAESGWFIGNDSGLGHMASALGVPTLTPFMRRGLARSWRPGCGRGMVALHPDIVPFGGLKERCCKHLLWVRRVLSNFPELRTEAVLARNS